MRAFTFDIPSVAAKLPDIEVYERKIGLRLPDDFREFCLTYNGGCPDSECDYYYVPKEFVEYKQEYESDGEEAYISVQELYGVHPPNDRFSTERVLTFLARFQGIPFEWIPVASDYCGNQVFLVAKEKVWAGVYFWDNETGLTFKIANSCGEFYDGLTNGEESQLT